MSLIWATPRALRVLLILLVVAATATFAVWLSLPEKKKEAIADKLGAGSGSPDQQLSPELVRLMNSYLDEPIRTIQSHDGRASITIEPHSIRVSNDYTFLRDMTPEKCAQACLADSNCEAYDYDNTPSSPEYKRCWKKKPAPTRLRRIGVVSGVKTAITFQGFSS